MDYAPSRLLWLSRTAVTAVGTGEAWDGLLTPAACIGEVWDGAGPRGRALLLVTSPALLEVGSGWIGRLDGQPAPRSHAAAPQPLSKGVKVRSGVKVKGGKGGQSPRLDHFQFQIRLLRKAASSLTRLPDRRPRGPARLVLRPAMCAQLLNGQPVRPGGEACCPADPMRRGTLRPRRAGHSDAALASSIGSGDFLASPFATTGYASPAGPLKTNVVRPPLRPRGQRGSAHIQSGPHTLRSATAATSSRSSTDTMENCRVGHLRARVYRGETRLSVTHGPGHPGSEGLRRHRRRGYEDAVAPRDDGPPPAEDHLPPGG
ncbi:hypothetical protein THAOC_07585, partial [Thalassiosira oceanica]